MSDIIDRGAEAMRAKRRELIAQPLDRIWPDLMRSAVEAMRMPTTKMAVAGYEKGPTVAKYIAMIDAALGASAPIPQQQNTTQEKT